MNSASEVSDQHAFHRTKIGINKAMHVLIERNDVRTNEISVLMNMSYCIRLLPCCNRCLDQIKDNHQQQVVVDGEHSVEQAFMVVGIAIQNRKILRSCTTKSIWIVPGLLVKQNWCWITSWIIESNKITLNESDCSHQIVDQQISNKIKNNNFEKTLFDPSSIQTKLEFLYEKINIIRINGMGTNEQENTIYIYLNLK